MKDLRIIIVSWNVQVELERCLRSICDACGSLTYDVCVVDNASTDGSVRVVRDVARTDSRVSVIANAENRGFAKACNQGLVEYDARYVLLLNPDTMCPVGSLENLVRRADELPQSGIFGPRLVNEDGTIQPSVRRFPTVWNQVGIMLKLHHLFRSWKPFRWYFADDLDLSVEQDVEQVMGACFLIRRELIESLGGLDERYFVWFEEVDYCKQAKVKGWNITYTPTTSILHRGGASFAQVFSLKKQRIFSRSAIAYIEKWHGGWQSFIIRLANVLSIFLTGCIHLFHQTKRSSQTHSIGREHYFPWILTVIAIESISVFTIFHNTANAIAALIVGLLVLVVSYRQPAIGLAAILLELIIGSKGALLQIWGWPGIVSLRMVLFIAFFLGWGIRWMMERRMSETFHLLKKRMVWVSLVIVIAYGILRGIEQGNAEWFSDANAWMFVLLLVPLLDLSRRSSQILAKVVVPVLMVGIIWIAMKTMMLEYVFSHGFSSIASELYLWVRRTGVGEVTLVTANAFRIFMQSYVWLIPATLLGYGYLLSQRETERNSVSLHLWFIGLFVALGISLSRSIWIGVFVGACALILMYGKRLRSVFRIMPHMIGYVFAACCIIFLTIAFPLPSVDYASLKDLFGSRASTNDAASVSRWNLLPVITSKIAEAPILGHGFGATVTYESKDPRILADHPDGLYTTYAFEWGWLEHWVKFGVFGFLVMIVLIAHLMIRAKRSTAPDWIRYGMIASLIGIAATHAFSPYLNHPIGLGMLLLAEGYLTSLE